MPEISYRDLKKYLRDREGKPFAPVYLIHGEELLTQRAFEALLQALVPASKRSINYEPMDATTENIREISARVNTYSLMPGTKVIAVRDSKIFYAKQDKGRLLENARKAFLDDDLKKAAGYLLSLMGYLNLSFENLDKANRAKSLGLDSAAGSDDTWLDAVSAYCRENRLTIPAGEDDSRILQETIERGFPENNHLIVTTDTVDKRRGLFKTISSNGVIIDCSVPKGDRRADRMAQESVLSETMNSILRKSKKTMDQAAYMALYEMTGFDLRTFVNNLEKLVAYVGDRNEITIADVESVSLRTKSDPIYEMTNALADRNAELTLFFLDSLLVSGFHPLQMLAALTNQVRKLLLVKDFVESPNGSNWQAACAFDYFQSRVIPAVIDYDNNLLDQIRTWEEVHSAEGISENIEPAAKAQKKKDKPTTDLLIAKNPKNSYPIYQLFKKSERFSKEGLIDAILALNEADILLKSSSISPKLVLEKVILSITNSPNKE
jgi:DNA polymerase-3 subunit delta